eukprot:365154_1
MVVVGLTAALDMLLKVSKVIAANKYDRETAEHTNPYWLSYIVQCFYSPRCDLDGVDKTYMTSKGTRDRIYESLNAVTVCEAVSSNMTSGLTLHISLLPGAIYYCSKCSSLAG